MIVITISIIVLVVINIGLTLTTHWNMQDRIRDQHNEIMYNQKVIESLDAKIYGNPKRIPGQVPNERSIKG